MSESTGMTFQIRMPDKALEDQETQKKVVDCYAEEGRQILVTTGPPLKRPAETIETFVGRCLQVDLEDVCGTIKDVYMKPHEEGEPYTVLAKVVPSGRQKTLLGLLTKENIHVDLVPRMMLMPNGHLNVVCYDLTPHYDV